MVKGDRRPPLYFPGIFDAVKPPRVVRQLISPCFRWLRCSTSRKPVVAPMGNRSR
jgi:hypothetical protein